jgi:hypothetical protein
VEELSASIIMVTLSSSETPVLTRATQRNIPEDDIIHTHSRETSNLTLDYQTYSLYFSNSFVLVPLTYQTPVLFACQFVVFVTLRFKFHSASSFSDGNNNTACTPDTPFYHSHAFAIHILSGNKVACSNGLGSEVHQFDDF